MCFTFLLAQGKAVGASLKEEDWVERAAAMIAKAEERGVKLLLPVDVVCADRFAEDAETRHGFGRRHPRWYDGPRHRARDGEALRRGRGRGRAPCSGTAPWACSRCEPFEAGTKAVAEAVAANAEADTVIGGGDSVAAVNKFGLAEKMTFISTGGGASMELVQGEALPGVEALSSSAVHGAAKAPLPRLRGRGGPARVPASRSDRGCGRTSRNAAKRGRKGSHGTQAMMAGNWKMNNTVAEAVVLTQEISNQLREGVAGARRRRRLPALRGPQAGQDRARLRQDQGRRGRAERVLGAEGRLHGRGVGAHAQGDRLRVLHRGPLRAPRAVRRDERGREPQGEGAGGAGLVRHRVRGRVAGRARRGHHRRVRVRPGARRVRRRGRAPTRQARGGLRAHLGHRHGPHGHARAGRGRVRRHPRDAGGAVRRRGGRRCACCTAAP